MSLQITFYGPHYCYWKHHGPRAWFYRPDENSSGGVGFQVPFVHVRLTWGHR